MLPLTIRNRTIASEDLFYIQNLVNEYWHLGRTHISRILCKRWNWFQPNGQLKDMACRELMLTLERSGHLELPPALTGAHNDKRNRTLPSVLVDQSPMEGSLADYGSVTMSMVRNTPLESLYNSLVHQYHYLGYRQIVGQHLKYNEDLSTSGLSPGDVRGKRSLPRYLLQGCQLDPCGTNQGYRQSEKAKQDQPESFCSPSETFPEAQTPVSVYLPETLRFYRSPRGCTGRLCMYDHLPN